MTLQQTLTQRLTEALEGLGIEIPAKMNLQVAVSADLRFGDYQTNAAMMLAKPAKMNPRALAEQIIEKMDVEDLAELEIAGPGFINFRVTSEAWGAKIASLHADVRLGVDAVEQPQTIVVDFSAPNVAKPMHVGHIRSTIIGDSLSRVAKFLGHEVKRDNHIGDWGTQFGMVIYGWKNLLDAAALEQQPLQELLRLYRAVNALCKEDEAVREECKQELVKLQAGDAENRKIWERCVEVSKVGLDAIYDRLDVGFDYWLGESHYNDHLAGVVEKFIADGAAKESDGAICIFSDDVLEPKKDPFKEKRDGEWSARPMIIRKADGGYNYATTDLATLDFRATDWQADSIWYVVDARQSLHFEQLFDVARREGWEVDLRHVSFGTILGKDGKPLKTRDGDLPQLADVLEDAVKAARAIIEEKSADLPEAEKETLSEQIGIGSVKFTELSHHRNSDYVYDLEKMVALQGDTAPYLQYSRVRCASIFRKLKELGQEESLEGAKPVITEDGEVHLSRMLSRYGEVLPTVLDDLRPNLLANYLLELARAFHSFFESCPVLKSEGATRTSRLVLCQLTSRVLEHGLSLLGIAAPERM